VFVKNGLNREIIRRVDPNAKSKPDGAIAKVPTARLRTVWLHRRCHSLGELRNHLSDRYHPRCPVRAFSHPTQSAR